MREQIKQIILDYQNAITEYFEMEISCENDPEHMDAFLENMKKEIDELFERQSKLLSLGIF